MTPKYYRNFQEVLAHLRHKDEICVAVEAKLAEKKATKKKANKKKEK